MKLSDLQRETLVRVIRATARGQWCRALSSGERVTLASLYTNGLLVRQVWKESKSAAARGAYSSPAHEYQAVSRVMQVATEMYPEALASAREGLK